MLKIVDIGARYGIFPNFQSLVNCAEFYLYEPDLNEANRLSKKYENNKNIFIKNYGLYSEEGNFDLKTTRHKGLTSFVDRREEFYKNHNFMREESDVVEVEKVFASTLNKEFFNQHIDYLKIDTEGTELKILEGGVVF